MKYTNAQVEAIADNCAVDGLTVVADMLRILLAERTQSRTDTGRLVHATERLLRAVENLDDIYDEAGPAENLCREALRVIERRIK